MYTRFFFREAKKENIIETPAFKRWFGKSKMVHNGVPMVFYHGTSENIKQFLDYKPNYFAYSRDYASGYHKDKKSKIIEVFLRIEHPFDTRKSDKDLLYYNNEFIPAMIDKYPSVQERDNRFQLLKKGETVPFTTSDYLFSFFRQQLRKKAINYDGVIVWEDSHNNSVYPMFPNQIKSLKNNGEFSLHSNNIYE